ncbi:hypothetical protein C1645_838186 [Glomus cerebriforme]|uniref:Uncharacterized protein n=1 Tax=Glomus cerebriforme TaxID=658196 RepID=A0A397SDB4_9GLOM|nr:hypothetical protein C1645_838186 [Glomus cerebriforme]
MAFDNIVVTSPTTDQKLGSTVDVKWDTTQISTGLQITDTSVPPKAVPHPFTDGHKQITLFDDPDLVGASCLAPIFDEDHDVTGSLIENCTEYQNTKQISETESVQQRVSQTTLDKYNNLFRFRSIQMEGLLGRAFFSAGLSMNYIDMQALAF